MNFTQNLSTSLPLSAFNNSVVKFSETGAEYATIDITDQDLQFKISAIDDDFYFNFKEVFKYVINQNIFADNNTYGAIVYKDEDLFKEVEVTYKTYNDSDVLINTATYTYYILKYVNQIGDKTYISEGDNPIFLHHKHGVTSYTLDYFLGFPFSISVFKFDTAASIAYEFLFPGSVGSQAGTMTGAGKAAYQLNIADAEAPLIDDMNAGETGVLTVTQNSKDSAINIKVHSNCGGDDRIYLKWLNKFGGWDYWLFNEHNKVQEANKNIGVLNNDFENIEDIRSRYVSQGNEVSKTITVKEDYLDTVQFERLSFLLYSPKIYLLINGEFYEVFIKAKNKYIQSKALGRIEFTIEFPDSITQQA